MTRLIAILAAAGLLMSSLGVTSAFADAFTDQIAALDVIKKAAEDFCYQIEQHGSRSSAEISGEASATLNAAIAKLADLHIKGAGKYETEESRGVLQKDLAAVLKSSISCKQDVFDTLAHKMLGWRPPPQSILNQIGNFMIQGQQMSNDFVNTGDFDKFLPRYREWSSTVANYLVQALDQSFEAQFLTAQPTIVTRGIKMKFENAGLWQKLEGQNVVLGQILTELRSGT